MVVHLFLNNNKALDFLPINSIKNGGITPVPDKVIAANGLTYKSHIKHAGRGVAARPGHLASVEPKNSLELFNSSIPTTNQNSNLRYAYDGHYVHQFSLSNGVYHWSGIKGKIDINQVPIDVRRKLGVNIKKLK